MASIVIWYLKKKIKKEVSIISLESYPIVGRKHFIRKINYNNKHQGEWQLSPVLYVSI